MDSIQKSVQHIEKIHSKIYTKTFNKDLLAEKKSLLRINLKDITTKQKEIARLIKENRLYSAQIRAYERITQDSIPKEKQ